MLYEVGPHWNPNHIAVALGRIDTAANRHAVGYVNDAVDPGGETKFGIAQNANPQIKVTNLTWNMAQAVYYLNYWVSGSCSSLPPSLALLHFDCCVNHGPRRAVLMLQEAAGVKVDGQIGPQTLAKIKLMNEQDLISRYCDTRENFYWAIVNAKPSQMKYLNGWLHRVAELRSFVSLPIKPSK